MAAAAGASAEGEQDRGQGEDSHDVDAANRFSNVSAFKVALPDMAVAADQISYEDLYARWEKGNWRAMEYDFAQDREDWHGKFSDIQRTAALWNYSLFFHGEDSVTDNLSPFIDAAPREEQKYFLATQQVDEARHAIFFKRFMHEVVGAGDGTVASGLEATRGELTYGFVKTFEHLDRVTGELRRDRSRTKLAQAVAMYHVIVEATLAQPGQHFIEAYLTEQDVLPAFRAGMRNVALDEQRHIGFGVKLLRDLAAEDPEVPEAVADLLRDVLPHTVGVFAPPNWDRRYSECFGFTLEEIYEEGATLVRVQAARRRAAGRGPARAAALPDRPAAARARAARDGAAAGGDPGREERAAGARPRDDGAAVRHRPARRRLPHRAGRAADRAVGLPRRRPVAPAARQRLDRGRGGAGRGAGHRVPGALRGLRRRGRRPARPAARDGDRAAARRAARCARCGRRAASSWPRVHRPGRRFALASRGGQGEAVGAGLRADLGDLHARVLEDASASRGRRAAPRARSRARRRGRRGARGR